MGSFVSNLRKKDEIFGHFNETMIKSRFHGTTKKFTFFFKNGHKNCFFHCQFQVKLAHTHKKKGTGFSF